ncbi:MAG: hypothetical protein EBV53_10370 [Proteobacteria bacterium]|nr:hypothetical protein [Pseudomonadota bacterium]
MARRILVGTDRGAFIYERDHTGEWQLGNQLLAGWRVDSITTLPGGRILAGTGHYVYGTTASYWMAPDGEQVDVAIHLNGGRLGGARVLLVEAHPVHAQHADVATRLHPDHGAITQ